MVEEADEEVQENDIMRNDHENIQVQMSDSAFCDF